MAWKYGVREKFSQRTKLWAAHLVIPFVWKGTGPEVRIYSDSWEVTNGLAGGQDGESLEDQGQGSLVKRHLDGPGGMGTKCEDLCVLPPPGKRHQITRHNDSANCHQPALSSAPPGLEKCSRDGRMETMPGLKTKVDQLLLLLNAHPASNRDQS